MVATNELTHAQAQLFIGAHEQILHHITKKLTAHFCAENGCGNCVPCRQVLEQRHHSILWLTTERLYTLDQIDPVTERLIMQLQDDEQFFFVIQHADKLSSASANKLLKPIEEPPAGYHFLLLAEHKEQVIPTIRSRCHIIESSSTTAAQPNSRLVSYFTALKEPSAVDFLKDLDKEKPNDQESLAILRTLYQYWSEQILHTQKNNSEYHAHAQHMVSVLENALQHPPMPGSSGIFWKNLYLQLF